MYSGLIVEETSSRSRKDNLHGFRSEEINPKFLT
jgi:hypothetical protein